MSINDLVFHKEADFSRKSAWNIPIPEDKIPWDLIKSNKCTYLFDQNGYDLCPLEIEYAKYNIDKDSSTYITLHRNEKHISLQTPWFTQKDKMEGYVLNHSMLLERFGYSGAALEQMREFAKINPLIYKVINIRSKWGIDFSLDYVDREGNCFEIFHYEHDNFELVRTLRAKKMIEDMVINRNFDLTAKELLERKNEWYYLEFFDQSDWKCEYFGVLPERFKMVVWGDLVEKGV